MGFEATLVLNVLASEEPVVFAGANVFGGGAAALGAVNLLNGTVADVTLRHYGPRRGLHYLYTAADFADGYQDDICGRDESWRLPTFGEAGALFGNYLAVLEADAETEGAGVSAGRFAPFPAPRLDELPPLGYNDGGLCGFLRFAADERGTLSRDSGSGKGVGFGDDGADCLRASGG